MNYYNNKIGFDINKVEYTTQDLKVLKDVAIQLDIIYRAAFHAIFCYHYKLMIGHILNLVIVKHNFFSYYTSWKNVDKHV